VLEHACYNCHPGKRTKCLRGAMASAGVVCQDCHGQMQQVGNDFSRCAAPGTPGCSTTGFVVAADYYSPASSTPRVPWANEPGCGSCHTGDALNNCIINPSSCNAQAGTLIPASSVNPADTIRLIQAYQTTGNCTNLTDCASVKPTPIVPANPRFAENGVPGTPGNGLSGSDNPKLYRVSNGGAALTVNGRSVGNSGHGGLFCEACHGSTHAEWPVDPQPANGLYPFAAGTFAANDNVTAGELQGHTGKIVECTTCRGTTDLGVTLDGPHGMHPVGNSRFVNGGHEDFAEGNLQACAACHGAQGQGTVLSEAAVDRTGLSGGRTITRGTLLGCNICHGNPFSGGGD
jgi:hypothetical protein